MGEEVGIIPGNDCPNCTPNPFAPGGTPKWVQVTFAGIEPCPETDPELPIPNRSFLAEQVGLCNWTFGSELFSGYWWPQGAWTTFICHATPAPPEYFWFQGGGGCDFSGNNQLNCNLGHDYHAGNASASPHGGPAYQFAIDYNMAPQLPLSFEEWDIGGDELMYRIADGTKKVNILFKYNRKN